MTDSGEDLKALLASDDRFAAPERGDLLQGTVIAQDSHGLIVDLGRKRDGVVPQSDLEKIPKDDTKLKTGDLISVMVIDPVDSDGNLLVSISQARESGDWLEARRVMENDELFNAEATSFNKGGLLVPFGHITGFVPASHLSGLPRGLDEGERLNYFNKIIGKKIPLKIIEVDPQRRRLVLSERKAIRQWRQDQKADVIKALKEGEHRKGVVTSLREFGAFVDIGGADGLIHISELSWTRIEDPSVVLEIGQEVETLIIRLDDANNRIGLSLKRLEPNPWELAKEHIEDGQELEGEVTVLSAPGAFVLVAEDLEGLLKTPNGPGDLSPGLKVKVRVVDFDPERERLDLELIDQTS
ncbi:MAG: S1 RNA-binding domain-containing protein [Anaerolineales bacterium]|nr:S1 RNA-binding domain-containing protein [Anaerolineales bacterium]